MRRMNRIVAVCAVLMLVLSLIPAQNAGAAESAAPKLNVSARTVYVGGSTVRTGNYAKGTYVLKVKNKPKKYTCTWENENDDVISVTAEKYAKATVTALKPGTSKVTAKFTDKTTKKTSTLTCTITVKKNCSAVQISGIPDEPMVIGDTLALSATMYDAAAKEAVSGSVTDIVKWKSSSKKTATVDQDGRITALKAGTVDITCYTVDAASGKYAKLANATAQKTVTIQIRKPDIVGITEIRQKSLNRIELTLGKDYSKVLTPDKLSVIGSDSIMLPVEEISFSEDGLTADVTVKGSFTESMTYVVAMSGTDATVGLTGSFSATKGVPVRLELATALDNKLVVAKNTTELGFKIFNAQDVDITPLDKNSIEYLNYKAITDYEALNTGSWYVNNGFIYVEYPSSQVTVKTTMSGSVIINGAAVQINLTSTDTVNSVNEASTVKFDLEKDLLLTDSTLTGEKLEFKGDALEMPAKEIGYRLVARVKDHTGNYIYSDSTGAGKITFESSKTASSSYVKENGEVTALDTAGSDQVYVKFGGQVIGTATIKINEARKASSISLIVDGTATTLAFGSDKEGVGTTRVDVVVYDQNGKLLPIKGHATNSFAANLFAEITLSSGCPSFSTYANADGTGYIEFNCTGFGATAGKSYTYKVSYKDDVYGTVSANLTLIVQTPNAAFPSTYTVAAEGNTDMTLSAVMNEFPYIKVILYEWKSNLKYGTVTPVYSSEYAAPVDGFFYKLNKAGSNEVINITGCTENDRIYTVYADYTGKLSRLDPGDYVLSVYQKKQNGVVAIQGVTFTLTGAAGNYTVKNTKDTTTQTITADTAKDLTQLRKIFTECFSVKKDDVEVSGLSIEFPEEPLVLDTGVIYFRTVSVTESVRVAGKVYSITYPMDIYQKIYDKTASK